MPVLLYTAAAPQHGIARRNPNEKNPTGMDCIVRAIARPRHRAEAGVFGIAAYAEIAAQLRGGRLLNLHAEAGRASKVVARWQPFAEVGATRPHNSQSDTSRIWVRSKHD